MPTFFTFRHFYDDMKRNSNFSGQKWSTSDLFLGTKKQIYSYFLDSITEIGQKFTLRVARHRIFTGLVDLKL